MHLSLLARPAGYLVAAALSAVTGRTYEAPTFSLPPPDGFAANAVPEAASLGLMLAGVTMLWATSRRVRG